MARRGEPPAVFLYGGTILPGHVDGRDITVQDVFEAVGAEAAGKITPEELNAIETHACPGPGSCAGMYTANTMAVAAEAIGMSLPGSASPPAMHERRDEFADLHRTRFEALRLGLRPRDVMTKGPSNAITCVMACGGRRTRCCTCGRSPPRPTSSSSWTTSTGSAGGRRTSATCGRRGGS
jgi:dihydroxy-acid dehydratase